MDIDQTSQGAAGVRAVPRRTVLQSLAAGAVVASTGFGLSRTAEAATQAGWRWCSKCEGMFYAHASAGMGVCPAGGAHVQNGSGQYVAMVGEDVAGKQQGGWRWCSKCEGMFYGRASAGKGVCPAGGAHTDAGSGHYAVLIGEDSPRKLQGGWRWCNKCEGMFYGRASAGKGVCPAHGAHSDTGSGHYRFNY
ncbi:MAG TPA: hypothetical protein VHT05_15755 [Candidatus Elarobacter sp.]|nr:hypothetical protein [Candidatus Elarobacter sp.]